MFYDCYFEWADVWLIAPELRKLKKDELFGKLFNAYGQGADFYRDSRRTGDLYDEKYGAFNTLRATKESIMAKKIDNASTQGVQHLKDIRYIISEFGLPGTFEDQARYYDFEQYIAFDSTVRVILITSTLAVVAVVLLVTSDLRLTFLVTFCICMTDLFLIGLMFYWDLAFNALVLS